MSPRKRGRTIRTRRTADGSTGAPRDSAVASARARSPGASVSWIAGGGRLVRASGMTVEYDRRTRIDQPPSKGSAVTRDPKPAPRRSRTEAVHVGGRRAGGAASSAIVHSSTFLAPTLDAMMEAQDRGAAGAFYQRMGHPTLHAVEQQLAKLEGAESALLF